MKKKRGRPKGSFKAKATIAQEPPSAEAGGDLEEAQDDGLKIRHYRLTQHLKKLRNSNQDISKSLPHYSSDREIAQARAQALDLAIDLADFYVKKGGKCFRKEVGL